MSPVCGIFLERFIKTKINLISEKKFLENLEGKVKKTVIIKRRTEHPSPWDKFFSKTDLTILKIIEIYSWQPFAILQCLADPGEARGFSTNTVVMY